MFEINEVGYECTENAAFRIERPYGSGDYLFLFFTTEVVMEVGGDMQVVPPNTFVLYEPMAPQRYYNKRVGFTNDYFHFTGDYVGTYLKKLGVPMNQPIGIEEANVVRFSIRKIAREFIRQDNFWEEKVDAQIQELFINLARLHQHRCVYSEDPYKMAMMEKFREAREEIFTNLSMDWSIDDMADLVFLSRSRFSVLYKEFFGNSPKEDLIRARMSRAKSLLVSSNCTVKEIAEKVGYDNIYHFSKQFKKLCGQSPRNYVEQTS